MLAAKSVVGFAVFVSLAFILGLVSTAGAQEPDVQIAELECNGDPERVLIKNLGDAMQSLAGWQLQSEPPGDQVYDLASLGGLQPGATVSIQSGPSASGVFQWDLEFIFRDDDPTDYARVVDDTGAVVHQVNCGDGVGPEGSPTPGAEPSATADLPNGGGAPPASGNGLSGGIMILLGGLVAAAGLVTAARSWSRLRPSPVVGTAAALVYQKAPAALRRPQPRMPGCSRGEPNSVGLGLALVGLLATGVVFLFLRHRGA